MALAFGGSICAASRMLRILVVLMAGLCPTVRIRSSSVRASLIRVSVINGGMSGIRSATARAPRRCATGSVNGSASHPYRIRWQGRIAEVPDLFYPSRCAVSLFASFGSHRTNPTGCSCEQAVSVLPNTSIRPLPADSVVPISFVTKL